ncbi:MAG: butyrate kinase [Calditrichaceae bacterium]|nr:butyrate kinase [Calditrichaceae bacterium]MBN2709670.1 butyrate kinase [Calditrichaceae bacterium]
MKNDYMPYILAVNPGSTTTKISIYKGEEEQFTEIITHNIEDLSRFNRASDQDMFRMELVLALLKMQKFPVERIEAVVGRGGLLRPIEGGTYLVNQQMINDLKEGLLGDHPSNCGGLIAYAIGQALGCMACIVDPVVVDELKPIARVSGMPLIERRSIFHALNQKAIARKIAQELKKPYGEINVIVAHLGGGITIGAHQQGRVVDVNNGLNGDGPFSPERSGSVPIGDLVKAAYSGAYTLKDMEKLVTGHGGMVAYLGTNDLRKAEEMMLNGDEKAGLIYEAMAYQIAKEIGAAGAVLSGKVNAVALTGGLAKSERFVDLIRERISFIAPVMIYPGEQEMEALALGALRILRGEENLKEY